MRMMAIRGVWTTNTVAFLIGVGMYSSFVLLPAVRPGADQHRLRLRRLGDRRRALPPPRDDRDHGRRPDGGQARAPDRLARRADRRRGIRACRLRAAGDRPQRGVRRSTSRPALLGIGIGLSFSAMANLIVENVRQEQTGVATGMNAVTRTLGGAFGGQLAATLLAGNLGASGAPDRSRLRARVRHVPRGAGRGARLRDRRPAPSPPASEPPSSPTRVMPPSPSG